MGILGLMQSLTPYGRRKDWAADTVSDYPSVIIDGPAYAYFIYGRVQARSRSEPGLPLDLIPTYKEVAAEAVHYLQALDSIGLKVRQIYFDGFLPASKRDTRLERWHHASNLKNRLRKTFPTVIGTYGSGSPSDSLSGTSPVELTKPPFLVCVIQEALHASEFGSVTETVAAEADSVCAQASTDHDLILTNDTDLILHKTKATIAFFSDCYLTTATDSPDEKPSFECTIFAPHELSDRIKCSDLVKLAFLMIERPHKTLVEYARLVRDCELSPNELQRFDEFKRPYEFHVNHSDFPACLACRELESNLHLILASLDARISETVHSSLRSTGEESDVVEVSLPPLADDVAYPSAWIPSRVIRKLIYPLLYRRSNVHRRFVELDRSGHENLSFTSFDGHVSDKALLEEFTALLLDLKRYLFNSSMDDAHLPGSRSSDASAWRATSFLYALNALRIQTYDLPSIDVVERVTGTSEGNWTWTHAHLSATVEGVIYSLRMLKQVTQVFLASLDTAFLETHSTLVAAVRDVFEVLDSMPALSVLLSKSSWVLPLGEFQSEFFRICEQELGLTREPTQKSKVKSKSARRKRGNGAGKQPHRVANKGSNYYSLLSTQTQPEDYR